MQIICCAEDAEKKLRGQCSSSVDRQREREKNITIREKGIKEAIVVA